MVRSYKGVRALPWGVRLDWPLTPTLSPAGRGRKGYALVGGAKRPLPPLL